MPKVLEPWAILKTEDTVFAQPRFVHKIEKFFPLPDPIRLHDLQNSARSHTEKKINQGSLLLGTEQI